MRGLYYQLEGKDLNQLVLFYGITTLRLYPVNHATQCGYVLCFIRMR